MRAPLEFDIPRISISSRDADALVFGDASSLFRGDDGAPTVPSGDTVLHELPEALHVLARDDLILDAAQEQHRHLRGEERDLRCRIPLLVAEERERTEDGERGGDKAGKGEEGVLENQSANL